MDSVGQRPFSPFPVRFTFQNFSSDPLPPFTRKRNCEKVKGLTAARPRNLSPLRADRSPIAGEREEEQTPVRRCYVIRARGIVRATMAEHRHFNGPAKQTQTFANFLEFRDDSRKFVFFHER